MKKIIAFFAVGILVLCGLEAAAFKNSEEKNIEKMSISFSKPIFNNENDYFSINFNEANAYLMEDGKPMLPAYVHTFTFPFGTKINKISCKLTNFEKILLTKIIKPTPKFNLVSQQIENKIVKEETINYGLDPYPDKYFDYDLGCGRTRDGLNVIVNVEIYPIKYYPNENTIEWTDNTEIEIEYELPTEPTTFNEQWSFIVLAPDEFSDELAPLITHKTNKGISTKFVSLNDIYNGVYFPATGRDNQEKIKYFIKNTIENWGTSFVLLVGGSSKFPIRISNIYVSGNEDIMQFVSDLYYADIYNETGDFCTWDSNDNDVFGEFNWGPSHNFDQVDVHPDVYLGRLACVNSNEVTTCVNKIKLYEQAGNEAYKQEWFIDAVFVGGETWPDDTEEIREGEYIQENIEAKMTGFAWNKIWESNGRLGTWIPPYGAGDITSTINKGCGFLEFSGHGNLNVWASHRFKSQDWIPTPIGYYLNNNVKSLSNGDELPITVIGGCLVGKFNEDPDCFAWSFLLNSGGGAIAVNAATESLYSADGSDTIKGSGGLIEISMFKSYKEIGATTFGEMWAWGLENYITTRHMKLTNTYKYDYVTVEEWEPFGDPTLQIAEESQAPLKPDRPSGSTNGSTGKEYTYTTSTTDPENDDIYYMFDWGDGKKSAWLGPYDSGTTVSAKKTWSKKGTYDIKAVAKDTHGKVSEWSDPLSVTIPRNRAIDNPLLRFFEAHPLSFKILQLLFNRLQF